MKHSFTSGGGVCEPFKIGENIWFYASRGRFSFYAEGHGRVFDIPTSKIKNALKALEFGRKLKRIKPKR